ncbi:MAG: oligosaccharide flippase family protein, partial [Clostridia bacterium]
MNKNAHKIFINTLLLTAASLVMRGVGLIFQVYLAEKIGASSIGIYSIITSVYTMFVTMGSGGIRFAVTRLTAAAVSEKGCVRKTISTSLVYALSLGLLSSV